MNNTTTGFPIFGKTLSAQRIMKSSAGLSCLFLLVFSAMSAMPASASNGSAAKNGPGRAGAEKSETLPGICPQGSTDEAVSSRSEAFLKVEPEGEPVMTAPFGIEESQVGGQAEDSRHATDGFPPAFTCDDRGNLYILDAANCRVSFYPRVKGVAKPSLKVLFTYGTDKVMRDIAFLKGRIIALANYGDGRIDLMTTEGRQVDVIEGVHPVEIAADSTGCLMVTDEGTGALLRFGPDFSLKSKALEGRPAPIPGGRGELFLSTEADGMAGIIAMAPSGEARPVALLPLDTPGWYNRQVKMVGVDRKGFLTVSHLMARDIDENHEYHEYRMYLIRINPVSGEILRRKGVAPFRESPFMVAPRLFVADPLGGVLTFYFSSEGYRIHSIDI